MKAKYKKLFFLLFIIIASILTLVLTSCGHKTLKGEQVNQFANASRNNNYTYFEDFIKYDEYSEEYKPKTDGGAIVPPLALSNSEFLYATTGGNIIFISNGEIRWEKKFDTLEAVNSNIAADSEQNMYAFTNFGNVYSYSYSGELRWKKNLRAKLDIFVNPCDLLALSDGIVCGFSDGELFKLDYNGNIKWKINISPSIQRVLSADYKENILLNASHNDYDVPDTLYSISPSGKVNWKVSAGMRFIKYPIAAENRIYISGLKYIDEELVSKVFCYDYSGKEVWSLELNSIPKYISADDEGSVYINAFQSGIGEQIGRVIKANSNGKIQWTKYYNFAIPTPIMLGSRTVAFLGTTHNTVGNYFIDKQTGSLVNVNSLSNFDPIIQYPTVRPDGAISYGYFHKVGFVRIDEPWLNKLLPW